MNDLLASPIASLAALRREEAQCRRCDLYRGATQVVPGEGEAHAALMLVGEQPGDREDRAGQPFVGPAGRVLDQALADAGIRRADAFVTNAVKHFKYELRGKRRLHKRPDAGDHPPVAACEPRRRSTPNTAALSATCGPPRRLSVERLAHSPPLARLSRCLPTSSALTAVAALPQALRI
ncbi:MAG: uracil-DNA glycosylase family protein [Stellaceae bacterium]